MVQGNPPEASIDAVIAQSLSANGISFCNKPLPCGHECKGVSGESKCLPCMKEDCFHGCELEDGVALEPQDMGYYKQKKETELIGCEESLLCGMCHVIELGKEPVAALRCNHVFHASCIAQRLRKKWRPSKRINLDYLKCPSC